MKRIFFSRKAKAIVDIVMMLTVIIAWLCSDPDSAAVNRWKSSHCIIGIGWFILIIFHIIQHWKFTKALTKKKFFLKNKITAFTTIYIVVMAMSILCLVVGFDAPVLRFHNVIGHFFLVIIIIHVIDKFKKFITLLSTMKQPLSVES